MRNRLLAKLGILLLSVFFLASMALYSMPQGKGQVKVQGKPDKPGKPGGTEEDTRELYKISITINPGWYGFGFSETCTPGLDYFYAERVKGGKFLIRLESDGIGTPGPGPDGELVPLTMDVISGLPQPTSVEGCMWWDGCYGNPPEGSINEEFIGLEGWDVYDYTYKRGYEWIFIRFLDTQDGWGPDQDVQIRWFFNYVPGPKGHGVGWTIHSQFSWLGDGEYVKTTNLFPPNGLNLYETWETDVVGTFWLLHDGIGLNDTDPERVPMPDCSIHLTIVRIQ